MFRDLRVNPFMRLLVLLVACTSYSSLATAEEEQRALGFSKLVLRDQDSWAVAQSDGETRVMALEYLRSKGLKAVGAEDLVFEKSSANQAEVILGGTIFDLECNREDGLLHNCVMGVRWELLDVQSDSVIYRSEVYGEFHEQELHTDEALRTLIQGALDGLTQRAKFRALLVGGAKTEKDAAPIAPATLQSCSSGPVAIEEDGNWAMRSVAVVKSGESVGSGFMISDGPFLLTAAHVASVPRPQLRFMNGHKSGASLIRVDRDADVALLRVDEPPENVTCLTPAASKSVSPGGSVYVIGSPGGDDLAFSMSRGILSGVRVKKGVSQFQTDASINLGNSGGPMVNAKGEALGIVSWKLAGETVEGLGFAVSVHDALRRLALSLGEETTSELLTAPAIAAKDKGAGELIEDKAGLRPVLDPEAEAESWARTERYESGPFTVPYALHLTPSVAVGYLPKGGAVSTSEYVSYWSDRESLSEPSGIATLELGLTVSTTFSFGLYIGGDSRISIAELGPCTQEEYGTYDKAYCMMPTAQFTAEAGYDFRLSSLVVLRPKMGLGFIYWPSQTRSYGVLSGGLDLPIRLGEESRLSLIPYVGAALGLNSYGWGITASMSPTTFRAGLALGIGLGALE